MNAVLVNSEERFGAFKETLEKYGVTCIVLDFDDQEWVKYDYSDIDLFIYYPSFKYSSNCPFALQEVYDNVMHIRMMNKELQMYPDPEIIRCYNDKYRQYLFLKAHEYPMPLTYPLFSKESVKIADQQLGYPIVLKNRYGAGGGHVWMVRNKKELEDYYDLSTFNFFNLFSARYFLRMITQRSFYYHLIKAKRMAYPFLSPPLLAQKYIRLDRDLKTVVGDYKVVEAHWRLPASERQWKVNIDAGGIGEWSQVPEKAIELSERLARQLKTRWINIDLMESGEDFLISEFSPVWHHYRYREKPSFVYKDDYNIDTPLEVSLDLERIIVESLIRGVER